MDFQPGADGGAFPSTRVSLVALARAPERVGFEEAWAEFFKGYWGPLYRYLVRTGSPRDDALDLLQDFFIEGTHGTILKGYDPERGCLRTYLLACLRNVRRKAFRKEGRRPDRRTYAFMGGSDETPDLPEPAAQDPEEAFEREWVRVLCRRTVDDVRDRMRDAGDEAGVALLDRWVLATDRPPAGEVAKALGISTGNLYTRATRLRAVLVQEAEAQARVYAGSEKELAEERDAVLRIIRGDG